MRLIGEGGMGAVYEAEHIGLHSRCAIKLLGEAFAHSETLRKRFRREARASAAVQHDNVVRVTDTGEDDDGTPFIVMELLDGESLASVIRRAKTLSPPVACAIVREILAGLAAAHDAGVIHRDLKAANVFLVSREDGTSQVKILDFGISKFAHDVATQVTAEGAVIGTPAYMAPEQIRGSNEVDRRVDIYAIGVLLYRLLVGELPFRGKTATEIYKFVATGEYTPVRDIRSEVPEELAEVVHRAMALDPADRFEDARSFSAALKNAVPATTETTLPPVLSSSVSRPPATERETDERESAKTRDLKRRPTPSTPTSEPDSHSVELAPTLPATVAPTERRAWVTPLVAALAAALVGGAVAAWLVNGEETETSAEDVRTQAAQPTGPALHLGVVEFADEGTIRGQFEPVAAYLSAELNRPVELSMLQPHEVVPQVLDHEIELAALSPYRYVTAKERDPEMRLLAVGYGRGGASYEGMIVSRLDSGILRLDDLVGKIFCYTDTESSSGYIYPRALLRQAGLDPDESFRHTMMTHDHSSSLRLVMGGQCDAAAVYRDIVFDPANGFDHAQLRILASTDRIPNDAYVATSTVEAEVADAVERALVALEPNAPHTLEVLGDTDLRGFIAGDDAMYDSARTVRRYLEGEPDAGP
ncbi:MAG: phosphate/phosphite/phosphonate ABC transporter substrate-binding protein [Sandaracinaceae bacterium]